MVSPAPAPVAPEFHAADAVASAELRLAMLRRLADIGMRMADEIGTRMIESPYHPEPRHEPGRAFATLSRGIRLTLVLQARVEREIIALRKGDSPPGTLAPEIAASTPDARILRSVLAAARRGGEDDAREAPERTREALTEIEDFEALLALPFRDCVATICADLDLDPDWSTWSDEIGFSPTSADPPRRQRNSAQPATTPHPPNKPPIIRRPAPGTGDDPPTTTLLQAGR